MRWLIVALVALSSPALEAAEDKVAKQAKAYFEEGSRYFDVGDYAQAVEAYKKAYLIKPDPVFLFNMAQCHRLLGDPATAAREYRTYLRKFPEAPNRKVVEGFIAAAEEEIQRRTRPTPPTEPIAPKDVEKPPAPAAPSPAAPAVAPQPAPSPAAPAVAPQLAPSPAAPAPPPSSATVPSAVPAPSTAVVSDVQASEAPRRPVWKSWWLWTGVALVVAAGGVTAGAVVATQPQGPPIKTSTGGEYTVRF